MAEVLAAHYYYFSTKNLGYYRSEYECVCGVTFWAGEHDGDPALGDVFAAHQAEVLAANGYGKLEDDTCCCGTCGL